MKPTAITGFGVASPFGIGWEAFRAGVCDPPGRAFTASPKSLAGLVGQAVRAAELTDFDPRPIIGDKGLRNNDRLTKLLLVAARLGLEAAGIKRDGAFTAFGPTDVGVCGSTAYGSLEAVHELHAVALLEDPRYLNPARFPNTVTNSSVGYVSIWEELRALNATITNGPTGALEAIDAAAGWIADGRAKAMLAGGAEALSEGLWHGFRRVGALAGVSGSAGVTLGEGACLAMLEDAEAARERGAHAVATIHGYGTAFDPGEPEDPMVRFSAEALERAIRTALADARVSAGDVSAVVLARSGLRAADDAERTAVGRVFDDVTQWAPKEWIGETLGASGAFGVAFACAAAGVRPGWTVVTSLGFYGNASALVLRRAE